MAVCPAFTTNLYIVSFLSLHTRELSEFPEVGFGMSLLSEGQEGILFR